MTKKRTLRQREVEALEQQTRILEAQHSLIQRTQSKAYLSNTQHTNRLQAYYHKALKPHLSQWTHATASHPMQMPTQCFMQGLSVIRH